jgi:hypothetical protein
MSRQNSIVSAEEAKQDAEGHTPLSVGRSQGMDGTRAVGAGNGVIGGIMPLRECRAGRASHGLTSSEAVSMQKPPTGEKLWGGRRRSWHLHRPDELMEVALWPKSMISAEA